MVVLVLDVPVLYVGHTILLQNIKSFYGVIFSYFQRTQISLSRGEVIFFSILCLKYVLLFQQIL